MMRFKDFLVENENDKKKPTSAAVPGNYGITRGEDGVTRYPAGLSTKIVKAKERAKAESAARKAERGAARAAEAKSPRPTETEKTAVTPESTSKRRPKTTGDIAARDKKDQDAIAQFQASGKGVTQVPAGTHGVVTFKNFKKRAQTTKPESTQTKTPETTKTEQPPENTQEPDKNAAAREKLLKQFPTLDPDKERPRYTTGEPKAPAKTSAPKPTVHRTTGDYTYDAADAVRPGDKKDRPYNRHTGDSPEARDETLSAYRAPVPMRRKLEGVGSTLKADQTKKERSSTSNPENPASFSNYKLEGLRKREAMLASMKKDE